MSNFIISRYWLVRHRAVQTFLIHKKRRWRDLSGHAHFLTCKLFLRVPASGGKTSKNVRRRHEVLTRELGYSTGSLEHWKPAAKTFYSPRRSRDNFCVCFKAPCVWGAAGGGKWKDAWRWVKPVSLSKLEWGCNLEALLKSGGGGSVAPVLALAMDYRPEDGKPLF